MARGGYHTKAAMGRGILVTVGLPRDGSTSVNNSWRIFQGKGYPDLCTRAFVRRLSDARASCDSRPLFYILVDGDPDGMAIMSTYKYGSKAHAHENARLNVPHIRWLGLRISDVVMSADPEDDDSFVQMTARDRKKAVAMLKNSPVWAVDGPEPEWRGELQLMLMLNLKAETEIMYDRTGGLEEWLDQKMSSFP